MLLVCIFAGLRYAMVDIVERRVCSRRATYVSVTYLFTRARKSHDSLRKIPRYCLIADL